MKAVLLSATAIALSVMYTLPATAEITGCITPNGQIRHAQAGLEPVRPCNSRQVQFTIGDEGEQGPRGPRGFRGFRGPRGPVGPVGPEGPAGEAGAQGEAGVQGEVGPEGPEGPQGPRGFDGEDGRDGRGLISFSVLVPSRASTDPDEFTTLVQHRDIELVADCVHGGFDDTRLVFKWGLLGVANAHFAAWIHYPFEPHTYFVSGREGEFWSNARSLTDAGTNRIGGPNGHAVSEDGTLLAIISSGVSPHPGGCLVSGVVARARVELPE